MGQVQVQRRRDTAANLASFVGAAGELIVDTTNNRVQVHDSETPNGWPAARLDETGRLKAIIRAVNLNVLGDTPLAISLPVGVGNYRITEIAVANSTGALPSTAKLGVYTAASQDGVAIASQQALSGITSNSANTSGNLLQLTLTNAGTTAFDAATLYVNVGTVQGAAATVDVIIYFQSL